MSTIGENIKRIRKEKNLTQKQLGELCSPPMVDSAIRRYEMGKANPKIETLKKIATALNVKLADLIPVNDALEWVSETIEENKVIRTYSAIDTAIKNNLDKMNAPAKKKVYDYTEDLIQNPKNWKDNK